jgi:hypothetical protein
LTRLSVSGRKLQIALLTALFLALALGTARLAIAGAEAEVAGAKAGFMIPEAGINIRQRIFPVSGLEAEA